MRVGAISPTRTALRLRFSATRGSLIPALPSLRRNVTPSARRETVCVSASILSSVCSIDTSIPCSGSERIDCTVGVRKSSEIGPLERRQPMATMATAAAVTTAERMRSTTTVPWRSGRRFGFRRGSASA